MLKSENINFLNDSCPYIRFKSKGASRVVWRYHAYRENWFCVDVTDTFHKKVSEDTGEMRENV